MMQHHCMVSRTCGAAHWTEARGDSTNMAAPWALGLPEGGWWDPLVSSTSLKVDSPRSKALPPPPPLHPATQHRGSGQLIEVALRCGSPPNSHTTPLQGWRVGTRLLANPANHAPAYLGPVCMSYPRTRLFTIHFVLVTGARNWSKKVAKGCANVWVNNAVLGVATWSCTQSRKLMYLHSVARAQMPCKMRVN